MAKVKRKAALLSSAEYVELLGSQQKASEVVLPRLGDYMGQVPPGSFPEMTAFEVASIAASLADRPLRDEDGFPHKNLEDACSLAVELLRMASNSIRETKARMGESVESALRNESWRSRLAEREEIKNCRRTTRLRAKFRETLGFQGDVRFPFPISETALLNLADMGRNTKRRKSAIRETLDKSGLPVDRVRSSIKAIGIFDDLFMLFVSDWPEMKGLIEGR